MQITFRKLLNPNPEIAFTLNSWANDPSLIPLMRPSRNQAEIDKQTSVTVASLTKRLEHQFIFLIYADDQLVGEMNFQIDPAHLYKKVEGTAWIGIGLGEPSTRGKGLGTKALEYLEQQIRAHGLKRIELGVFAFNAQAFNLYKKFSYQEIGRINAFTFWEGRMWADIRMEKYLT